MSSRAAIVLAAGKGTRLVSRTPKVLHRLGGAPLATYPIRRALETGADPIVVVVGYGADRVRAELDARFPGRLRYAEQTEQLGTGHAARVGLEALDGAADRVLILSGDVPMLRPETLAALVAGPERVRLLTTRLSDPTGYGRIVRDDAGQVVRIVEQRDATPEELGLDEVNAGTYLVETGFLRSVLGSLSSDNAQNEYYLTDVVAAAAAEGPVGAVVVDDPVEVQGVNTRAELAELARVQWRRKAEALMATGVTILEPDSVLIDPEAQVGMDSIIHPRVTIRGASTIGEDCEIETGSVLDESHLGRGVSIHPYSVLESARVGDEASVGPFARLRPGTELGSGSRVGNFVETKNTTLAAGAKANHLTYLGDATVGPDSNVGAGTITCNYDGVGKYRTEIGRGVFVGSNATLVAPLAIGDEAYVAAGSTVTHRVPPDAVAFGRARQVNKEGRASALRQKARSRKARRKGD